MSEQIWQVQVRNHKGEVAKTDYFATREEAKTAARKAQEEASASAGGPDWYKHWDENRDIVMVEVPEGMTKEEYLKSMRELVKDHLRMRYDDDDDDKPRASWVT